jgi:hypothetical protein
MTDGDRDLDRKIRHQEALLAKVRPGSWTAGKIRETLDWLRAQRALPRDQRCRWQRGTL